MIAETPCLLVDLDKMALNIKRMTETAKKNGVALRPHSKTHKIPEIAAMQIEAGAAGINVAKVSEAEVMADGGIKDIFIAYPVIGESKIKRVLELNKRIRLIAGVDSMVGAKMLSEAAGSAGQEVEVRLEVDTGLRRTGIPYPRAAELAVGIAGMKGLRLTGIYTFKGLVYQGKATVEREKAGFEEGRLMVALAEAMRREGIGIKDVSVGSTPTYEYASQVKGITEIRPGTCVFNDVMMASVGYCTYDECAATVLATVVSRPSGDLAVIDGGGKTFATDFAFNAPPYYLKSYGKVLDGDGLTLERLTEEHGMIKVGEGARELKIGERVRIIPNHICSTVNLHNKVYFVRNGEVIREVKVAGRGMLY